MKNIIIFAAAFAVIALVLAINDPSITGQLGVEVSAETLNDKAKNFFDVSAIIFPPDICGQTLRDFYDEIASVPIDVSTGFESHGVERFSSISFVVNRHEDFGTIDFVKSPSLLADKSADSLISVSSEAIVRIPKAERTTYLAMDLYGKTEYGRMYVKRGRFSIPTSDCVFIIHNGESLCDCDVHTIKGISVAGITSASPVEDRYKDLLKYVE